jgi:hypothetical protein
MVSPPLTTLNLITPLSTLIHHTAVSLSCCPGSTTTSFSTFRSPKNLTLRQGRSLIRRVTRRLSHGRGFIYNTFAQHYRLEIKRIRRAKFVQAKARLPQHLYLTRGTACTLFARSAAGSNHTQQKGPYLLQLVPWHTSVTAQSTSAKCVAALVGVVSVEVWKNKIPSSVFYITKIYSSALKLRKVLRTEEYSPLYSSVLRGSTFVR